MGLFHKMTISLVLFLFFPRIRVYDLAVAKKDERLKLFKPPQSHRDCPATATAATLLPELSELLLL